jgi:hypothetical protein
MLIIKYSWWYLIIIILIGFIYLWMWLWEAKAWEEEKYDKWWGQNLLRLIWETFLKQRLILFIDWSVC